MRLPSCIECGRACGASLESLTYCSVCASAAVEVPSRIPVGALRVQSRPMLIQQIIHDRVVFVPVIEPALLNGVGPRAEVHGLGAIANHPYSAPYEDLKIKAR